MQSQSSEHCDSIQRDSIQRDSSARGSSERGSSGERRAPWAVAVVAFAIAIVGAAGCTGSPIGDPCVPESIPEGGFDPRETYLETSSVQCRTRVCMVYQLDGNPEHVDEDGTCPPGADDCVSRGAVESQVFCSCRCQVPEGAQANTPLCSCGDGFTCVEDVVTTGGPGVQGGYCVPCIRPDEDRLLDTAVFQACPTED